MDWKKIIEELQATGLSQAAIAAEVGKSQAWVSATLKEEYSDVKWGDGDKLLKLHAEHCQQPAKAA